MITLKIFLTKFFNDCCKKKMKFNFLGKLKYSILILYNNYHFRLTI